MGSESRPLFFAVRFTFVAFSYPALIRVAPGFAYGLEVTQGFGLPGDWGADGAGAVRLVGSALKGAGHEFA